MATIKDVAKAAGVSISTVSYAMNGSPKVSRPTSERIRKIAEELDYYPNGIAKNLKKRKVHRIGLFVHSIADPYYKEFIAGIEDTAFEHNYGLITASFRGDQKSAAYSVIMEGWVDCGIIHNASLLSDEFIRKMSSRVPLVLLDRKPFDCPNVCTIVVDNFKSAYELTNHLIALGHKKFGFIQGSVSSYDNIQRYEGYKKALSENGLALTDEYNLQGDYTQQSSYNGVQESIGRNKLPDVYVAANDVMAIGAIHALQEHNIQIPGKIAICGFDDIQFSTIVHPALTTVHYDIYGIGKAATSELFTIMQGKESQKEIHIGTRIIVRDSCGSKDGKQFFLPSG